MNGLKLNDFFCGAGGMGLGFKNAGYETVGAWDFDKYAVESYRHNVDDVIVQADIVEMTEADVPDADIWTFGFPCQDLSVAGKQAGLHEGQRSKMFFEVMRLLAEVSHKPPFILAENVKGLNKYLPVLKEEYAKAGYVMYVKLFNSKFWGVPQNRERYFVLGIRKDLDIGKFRWPKQDESFVPKLSSILESEVDEKFYIADEKAAKVIEQAKQRVELKGTHSCITPDRVDKRQNGRRAKEEEAEMFTLTSQDLHGIIKVGDLDINAIEHNKRVYSTEGIAPTCPTGASTHVTKIVNNFRVRKLTPREYARLQGFPDSFEIIVSNSQFYKQMGNAVTVNVAEAIATSIKEWYHAAIQNGGRD